MNKTDNPIFIKRLDEIKNFHQICLISIRARYLDAAIEKACKITYLLQTNLNDINTLIEILHTKIENSEDNEPTLFDKKELETKELWVD